MSVAEFVREDCREFRAIRGNCRSDTLVVCGADGGDASIIRCVEDDCGVKRGNEEQGWFHNLARLEVLEQIGNTVEIHTQAFLANQEQNVFLGRYSGCNSLP